MASESTIVQPPSPAPARSSSVITLLRLEGLAVAAVSAALYARTGASWWLFAALWLLPDLSMLGYLASPCWGARCTTQCTPTLCRRRWHCPRCCFTATACCCLLRLSGSTTLAWTGCSATASNSVRDLDG